MPAEDSDNSQDEASLIKGFLHPRREFLQKVGGLGALAALGTSSATGDSHDPPPLDDPFSLGVASGDPLPHSVVLWTRLAPEPLEADGGMPDRQVPVNWKVATDEDMQDVVESGSAVARPEHAHSVHVEPEELEPNAEYYYQFRVGSAQSPVGRTKTSPTSDSNVDEFDFAFVSCQRYVDGYYTSHEHLAEEELDVAFHLGDYIYETGAQGTIGRGHEPARECETLTDYRVRYAQYKSDSNLQAAHAAFPWIVTWDDHEVVNNYADENDSAPPEEFLERRAAAYKAYWEHQPLRRSRMPDGPDMPLYRRFTFGDLAEFNVLDTRQYRDALTKSTEVASDPDRTILGDEQEEWLLDGLDSSSSRWNVLANQTVFAARDTDLDPDEVDFGGGDKWDGYRADRQTLLDFMADRSELNAVVISGDVHNNAVYDLKADFHDPESETVATEFVGTSISSLGDKYGRPTWGDSFEPRENTPWRKFWNNNRGYVKCTLTSDRWQTDYRVVSTVEEPSASVSTLASFFTHDGAPGAKQLTGSIDMQVPASYDPDGDADTFEIDATFLNPAGEDGADVTMENLALNLSGLPETWSVEATTETEFESVANGESVTVTWEVTPVASGTVEPELEVTYEIDGESYRHVITEPLSEALIARWQFEDSTEDSSSYDHTFSLENGAGFDDQVAIEGEYSLLLDGLDDYIGISDSETGFLHEEFTKRTVSTWVRPYSTEGTPVIFTEGGSKDGLALRIDDGRLEAGVANDFNLSIIGTAFPDSGWAHVAVVFDEGEFTLYVNGNEEATTDVEFDTVPDHGSPGAIGRAGGGSYAFIGTGDHFGGRIDDTSVYNSALSGAEIETLADRKQRSANLGVDIPALYVASEPFEIDGTFENPDGPRAADVTMENVSLHVTGLPEDWSITATTQTEFGTVSNGETVTANWEVDPAESGDVDLELEARYEIEGESYQHGIPAQLREARIAYWRYENSTEDSSSYDHTFSLENGAGFDDQVAAEGDYSLALDGEDDYIGISDRESGFLHEAFRERSVAMWVRPAFTSGEPVIFSEGGSKNGWALRIRDGTLEAGFASNWDFASIDAPFTRTDWAHVAVVFDEGAMALYVDGSEVASAEAGFDSVPDHGSAGAIGRAGGGSYAFTGTGDFFGGHVDATSVYASALSPEKVAELSDEF